MREPPFGSTTICVGCPVDAGCRRMADRVGRGPGFHVFGAFAGESPLYRIDAEEDPHLWPALWAHRPVRPLRPPQVLALPGAFAPNRPALRNRASVRRTAEQARWLVVPQHVVREVRARGPSGSVPVARLTELRTPARRATRAPEAAGGRRDAEATRARPADGARQPDVSPDRKRGRPPSPEGDPRSPPRAAAQPAEPE
jgi:hypothetical protein